MKARLMKLWILFLLSGKKALMCDHLEQGIKWNCQGHRQACQIYMILIPHMMKCTKICWERTQSCIRSFNISVVADLVVDSPAEKPETEILRLMSQEFNVLHVLCYCPFQFHSICEYILWYTKISTSRANWRLKMTRNLSHSNR